MALPKIELSVLVVSFLGQFQISNYYILTCVDIFEIESARFFLDYVYNEVARKLDGIITEYYPVFQYLAI